MRDKRDKITLVGAGPVGSLLALFLARRGFNVEVFERRADMRKEAISAGRSINLAVSTRGLHALSLVGLEQEILSGAVPMRGRMMHGTDEKLTFQPYGKDETQYINSISRGGLNQALMTAAEKTGRVQICFHEKAKGLDFETKELQLDSKNVAASVVIGTDGASSVIRESMQRLKGYESSESLLDYGYKELHIPAGRSEQFQMERNALHIWPRGTYMLIALPNLDGSFTCTLFLPFRGDPSFESLVGEANVDAFFKSKFPDAHRLIPSLTDDFFANPTGHMVTVRCFPWNVGGQALVLGDAAHAIVPFFGQGMNCGFEDVTVLDQLIEEQGEKVSWSKVFDEFGRVRKPNCDAIAELALENFVEMRDKVADPKFLLEREVEKILQSAFPDDYISRYALVTFTRVPYQLALRAGVVENEILSELCQGLSRAADVDLSRAKRLIDERLRPILSQRGG